MRIPLKAIQIAKRRNFVVALAAALGALGAWTIASTQQTSYSARAVMVVPIFDAIDGQPVPDPEVVGDNAALGRTLDASRLAQTYASLLIEDTQILESVAATSDLTVEDLTDIITVRNIDDTPLIEVIVDGSDEAVTSATLSSFVAAVTGESPLSRSIAPDSLQPLRVEAPVATPPTGQTLATAAGLILGALTGAVVATFWERSQRRLDTAPEVRKAIGLPTRDLPRVAEPLKVWALKRWYELAGEGGWVLAVGCGDLGVEAVEAAIRDLATTTDVVTLPSLRSGLDEPSPAPKREHERTLDGESSELTSGVTDLATSDATDRRDTTPVPDLSIAVPLAAGKTTELVVRCRATPGRPGGYQPGLDEPALVILVIGRGVSADDVDDTIEYLRSTDLEPAHALLVD